MNKTLLTKGEQRVVSRTQGLTGRASAFNRAAGLQAINDLNMVVRDLDKRAVIAIRDEKYRWRDLLVDWIEQAEQVESDLDPVTLRYIYERVVAEHETNIV